MEINVPPPSNGETERMETRADLASAIILAFCVPIMAFFLSPIIFLMYKATIYLGKILI